VSPTTRLARLRTLALAVVLLAPLAVPGAVRGASTAMPPGTTLLVSGSRPPTQNDPEATAPAISDDGSVVSVLVARVDSTERRRVEVHDVRTDTRRVVGPQDADNSAPSLSGDGTRVAYESVYDDSGGGTVDGELFVTDLAGSTPRTRALTGTADDLEFQRVLRCDPDLRVESMRESDRCGPQLSGDGRSVVFPARLSIDSPDLVIEDIEGTDTGYLGTPPHGLALVDLGSAGDNDVLFVRSRRASPLTFDAVTVSDPTAFELFTASQAGPFCSAATVGTDAVSSCNIGIRALRGGRCGTVYARLDLHSRVARGRTAMIVAMDDYTGCPSPGAAIQVPGLQAPGSPTPGGNCAALPQPAYGFAGSTDSGAVGQVSDVGEVDLASYVVTAQQVHNFSPYSSAVVGFSSSDCAMQLVTPVTPGTDPPCIDGAPLGPSLSCTAYVAFRPDTVAPYVASVTLLPIGATVPRAIRFVAGGRDDVVVARRDLDGNGDFAGPGDPAARVVSVVKGGEVDGITPSISTDGRYVAFASTRHDQYAGTQVLVHDTDRHGDRSYVSGSTTVVSQLGGDQGLPAYAFQPSLSGDGGRIAYVTKVYTDAGLTLAALLRVAARATVDTPVAQAATKAEAVAYAAIRGGRARFRVDAQGRAVLDVGPTVLADAEVVAELDRAVPLATSAPASDVQVRVHDLRSGRVLVPSSPAGNVDGAERPSFAPSLSRDGSTIAFVSDSPDLVPSGADATAVDSVYVRDLGRDLAGTAAPQIVSLHADADVAGDDAGVPAIDATGSAVAFGSADRLTPQSAAVLAQTYVRARPAALTISPSRIRFPNQPVGTTGPERRITVSNAGPGPATLDTTVTGAFRVVDGCDARTLHTGESCAIDVAFSPRAAGPQHGSISVTSTGFAGTSSVEIVGLAGAAVGPPLTLTLSPTGPVAFPATGIGQTSKPVPITVTNTSTVPVRVSAGVLTGADSFSVTAAGGCARVEPHASCTLRARFRPRQLGTLSGSVQVMAGSGDVTVAQVVVTTGAVPTPELNFSPAVAHEGRVTFVTGTDFLPGQPLQLAWDRGPVSVPRVIPDADGSFRVPVVVLKGAGAGLRVLTVSMPSVAVDVQGPPLLVVLGSAQPPDFVTRN